METSDIEHADNVDSVSVPLTTPPSDFVHNYFKSLTAGKKKKKKKKKKKEEITPLTSDSKKKWIVLN